MKKRMFCLILCLLMAVSLSVPAFGAYEYGNYYDETEVLWTQDLQTMAEETIPALIDTYDFDIRIDVYTSWDDSGIAAVAEYVYGKYEYGVGDGKNGVSLSVYVSEDETGWYPEDWYVYVGGSDSAWYGLVDVLVGSLNGYLTADAWNGNLEQDSLMMTEIVGLLVSSVSQYSENAATVAEVDFTADGNIIDMTGLLTEEQDAALEQIAVSSGEQYGCGCYAILTDDFRQFGETTPDAVINLYHDNMLGIGDGRDGILLLVDVVNRKFAFFVYGGSAEYIFDAYGQEELEKVFVDDLGEDLWYDALEDYARECGVYMALAAEGNPVRESKTGGYVLVIFAALLIAAAVTFVLLSQMKSVAEATEAAAYVSDGGLLLTERSDMFMYKTTTTRDLSSDDDDSSSSSSFSGGGGSGRSGSF